MVDVTKGPYRVSWLIMFLVNGSLVEGAGVVIQSLSGPYSWNFGRPRWFGLGNIPGIMCQLSNCLLQSHHGIIFLFIVGETGV